MFDVKKHLIKLNGNRLYLPVAARLVWFRQEHPDWGIETRAIELDHEHQFAIFEAFVYNADGKLMAKGTKKEDVRGFPDYIEKAETGAIGRALAVCGFGTQFAPDLDEVTAGRIVDSPQRAQGSGYDDDHEQNADRGYRGPELVVSGGARTDRLAAPISLGAGQDSQTHTCSECGRGVTKGQETISTRKYGASLCLDCQKGRRATEAAA
jgi:hypothetical protein